ncbi:lipid A-modifier LpxR family protein [Cognatitamlana onchidii]|uniref:lipid A-modifier LpxR family protein n=1 Tax=Cognatitamlana onchidii TaxID=2562860 RepID=UPI0010A5F9AD|nr:lipid A-modifier LpxR family protein [Algibacter onchidii]
MFNYNIFIKISIFLCFCCATGIQNGYAQVDKTPRYAVEISSDNDAFALWDNLDRYYTFGIGPKFYLKTPHFLGLQNWFKKKNDYFFSFGLRSEGYTPTRQSYDGLTIASDSLSFERPFAGLLYGTLEANYIFKRSFVKTELLLGVMGPSAFAQEIQNWLHSQLPTSDEVEGWEYQIPDQVIINFNIQGAYTLHNFADWFDVYTSGEARFGNLYIDASPLIGLRIGKFESISKSSVFNNHLLAPLQVKEIFFRSSFAGTFALFNGTAQGNLFNNDFPYALDNINNFHTTISNGIFISFNRVSLSYDNIFTFGKVNKGAQHIYGKIDFKYRF